MSTSSFAITLSGEAGKTQTSMLPHIIQICKFEWKCAGCNVLQLCLSVQIENIDACLSFLAAKGVNIQGLSSEGKLDSCTSAFTGTREVDPNLGQARPGLGTKQMSFMLYKKDKEWQLDTLRYFYGQALLPGHTTLMPDSTHDM